MIDVEDWAEIRRLHRAEELGIKTVALRLGIARNTVRAALRSDVPPKYERMPQGSIMDPVESEIPCSATGPMIMTAVIAVSTTTPTTTPR